MAAPAAASSAEDRVADAASSAEEISTPHKPQPFRLWLLPDSLKTERYLNFYFIRKFALF